MLGWRLGTLCQREGNTHIVAMRAAPRRGGSPGTPHAANKTPSSNPAAAQSHSGDTLPPFPLGGRRTVPRRELRHPGIERRDVSMRPVRRVVVQVVRPDLGLHRAVEWQSVARLLVGHGEPAGQGRDGEHVVAVELVAGADLM